MKRSAHWLPLLAVAIPLAVPGAALQEFGLYVMVYGLMAMSLNLLVGYTGLVSFGHAMFFALGAYSFVFGLSHGWGLAGSLAAAASCCAITAGLVGAVCVRLHDAYFSFITLAFAMLFVNLLDVGSAWSGGDAGLPLNRSAFMLWGVDLSRGGPRYAFVFGVFALSAAVLMGLVRSSFGTTLRMVRDNAQRAACLGISVYPVKLAAFTLAGLFGGVSGALATLLVSGAYPTFAGWTTSGDAIFAILLGGAGYFWGPVMGAALLRMLIDFTTTYSGHTGLVLGALILCVVLGLRQSPLDFLVQRLRRRPTPRGASLPVAPATRPAAGAGADHA